MHKIKGGYTLVELVISLGIFSVVLGSLFTVLVSQNNFFGRANARMEVDASVRKVMMNMVKELRAAKIEYVDIRDRPLDQGGVSLDHINGRSITFQVPVDWDGDADVFNEYGVIEWGAEGQLDWFLEFYYDSTNGQVIRRVWDGSNAEVSSTVIAAGISGFNIQGFEFNSGTGTYQSIAGNYTKDIVEITVTAQKTTLGGRALATPIAVTLRNRVHWRN